MNHGTDLALVRPRRRHPAVAFRQAGATGIVTALHHIPYGDVWPVEAIEKRKAMIAADPRSACAGAWSKACRFTRRSSSAKATSSRCSTITASRCAIWPHCGIPTSATISCRCSTGPAPTCLRCRAAARRCASTRTNTPPSIASCCDGPAPSRPQPDVLDRAKDWFDMLRPLPMEQLLANIMAGLPGAFDRYDISGSARHARALSKAIGARPLRENLVRFLQRVIPTAEEVGIRMCDPSGRSAAPPAGPAAHRLEGRRHRLHPRSRPSPSNGLTLLHWLARRRPDNDVPAIAKRFADRIYFAHLRNVTKEPDGSFMEADHLGGDVDMVAVVARCCDEQKRRRRCRRCRLAHPVPARPRPRVAR